MMIFIFIFLMLISPAAGLQASDSDGWELVLNENSVTIYSRPMKGAEFLEYKGITVINQRMDIICEMLSDISALPKWMPNCDSVQVVRDIDYNSEKSLKDNYKIMYIVTDIPWPLADRDVVSKTVVDVDETNGNILIDILGIKEPLVPVTDGIVRMTDLKAKFIIEYIGKEKTRMIYFLSTDPAGSVPPFMVNLGAHKNPYRTLLNLREMAMDPKYAASLKEEKSTVYSRMIVRKIAAGIENKKK